MKLNLITEVFDKPSLKDISIKEIRNKTIYTFEVLINGSKYPYEVTMEREDKAINYIEILLNKILDDKHEQVLKNYSEQVGIYLSMSGTHAKTKMGREFEVYQKLISAVHHYVKNYKPVALEFSGYSDDMDLVYHRMVKMANKTWPEDSYVPISTSQFIRKEVHDFLLNDEDYQYLIQSGMRGIQPALDRAKRHKIREKINKQINKERNAIEEKITEIGDRVPDTEGNKYIVHRYDLKETTLYRIDDTGLYVMDSDKFKEALFNNKPLDRNLIQKI